MTSARRNPIFNTDALVGGLYIAVFAVLALVLASGFFYATETAFYDRALGLKSATPDPDIAIIAIDDDSVRNIGRFPFSRDVIATLIDTVSAGEPKVIVSTMAFPEAQIDAGADYLREIDSTITRLAGNGGETDGELGDGLAELSAQVRKAIGAIAYDEKLGRSIAGAGNVVLPLFFDQAGMPVGRPDFPMPPFTQRHLLAATGGDIAVPFLEPTVPLPLIGDAAVALGHLGLIPDRDDVVRDVPLVARHYDERYPALALISAARALNLTAADIEVSAQPPTVRAGGITLATAPDGRLLHHFYRAAEGDDGPFRVESFYDVFSGLVPANSFRGKTVLIGPTAAGIGDALATPAGTATAPVILLAHAVSSILQQEFVTRPPAATMLETGIMLIIALYILFALPRLGAALGALTSLALLTALLLCELYLLVGTSRWLQFVTPALFLVGGHLVMTVKRFGVTERLKLRTDEASAESNRMLGLAFQGQGQLDMAFEKFRQCPMDDAIMEPLYNLALDFERKRQFNKAGAVYARMARHDPDYRDLRVRVQRSEALDETLIFGTAVSEGGTLISDQEGVQKPMLGRYVVEKELGKGAMGTVYLGRDPKINRIVAIKTIAISQEFDENEVASVRERFFREAETAGRLNHPDIVTVYDAGEEHDLAYIAMEFLRGTHMSGYTRSDNLLPVAQVIDLMARVADALGYAHREDVVHRDIKPANIMFDRESGDLKITDFGIARITSSSKTKTGIVLGTPSYMSPEQLAGKNVTGRSDLFSLGVTLYQLLAGQLPFRADSMATLMYKIANEPHTPLRAARPELPACLESVIDRALSKDLTIRYETGAQMALELRECHASIMAA